MEAKRDENRITTLLAVLSTDGKTPNIVKASPTTHRLQVSSGVGINGKVDDARDENRVPTCMAISSADGITTIPVYSDPLCYLLITNN